MELIDVTLVGLWYFPRNVYPPTAMAPAVYSHGSSELHDASCFLERFSWSHFGSSPSKLELAGFGRELNGLCPKVNK